MRRDVDVAVVGGGILGAAVLRALAQSGAAAVLLERFRLGHAHGSSHGSSRIFRLSYPDPAYTDLARHALAGWRELETERGRPLLVQTGTLDAGDEAVASERSLARHGVSFDAVSGAEAGRRWPVAFAGEERLVFQADGGYLLADQAHTALAESARAHGGEIAEDEQVLGIDTGRDGVVVATGRRELAAGAVVVAAGAWAPGLLAPLGIELDVAVTRETVAYFAAPAAATLPSLIEYPSAASPLPDRQAYYALAAPGRGLKAGVHHSGAAADPDAETPPDDAVVEQTAAWVARRFPAADPAPLATETCLYTNTPDESFVVEAHGRVVVVSACSGHGFKFATVHGERAAALALGSGRAS